MADGAPKVVCLLPARDAAADLPGWFESVERFADAVVALDDGSTDDTAALLDAHPLVRTLLRLPVRVGHAGWDDSRNRNALLQAAAELGPEWIVAIDTDERLPAADGDALRRFIDADAVPGFAYGFERYQMAGDLDHYDVMEDVVYRLFAHRPGQVLPSHRLHFTPVPTSIPRGRRLATDLRVQHLCWLDEDRRRARRQKYREADPDQRWDEDYSYLDRPPGRLHRWPPRRPGAPVILRSRYEDLRPAPAGDMDLDGPVLTVVVVVADETLDAMIEVLDHLALHACGHPTETVVLAGDAALADDVARLRPGSFVVALHDGLPEGTVRNLGLQIARGDYVAFLDGPVTLAPGALDALIGLHDQGHAIVTGDVDAHRVSFARETLVAAGAFDPEQRVGSDAVARERLLQAGHREARCALIR